MEFFQKDTLIVVVVVTIIFLIKKLMVTKNWKKRRIKNWKTKIYLYMN